MSNCSDANMEENDVGSNVQPESRNDATQLANSASSSTQDITLPTSSCTSMASAVAGSASNVQLAESSALQPSTSSASQETVGSASSESLANEQDASQESSLNAIVRCTVCGLAPLGPIFQCRNTHLICAGCYQNCMFINRRVGIGRCRECGVNVYYRNAVRNIVAEQLNEQLMTPCPHCGDKYMRRKLKMHCKRNCLERPSKCKYAIFGCDWRGAHSQLGTHECGCEWQHKTGAEVYAHMVSHAQELAAKQQMFKMVLESLQRCHVVFKLAHVLPIPESQKLDVGRTLYFGEFNAVRFGWSVDIIWHPNDATHAEGGSLRYRLSLVAPERYPGMSVKLSMVLIWATACDVKLIRSINHWDCTQECRTSPEYVFFVNSMATSVQLLRQKGLKLRLCVCCRRN